MEDPVISEMSQSRAVAEKEVLVSMRENQELAGSMFKMTRRHRLQRCLRTCVMVSLPLCVGVGSMAGPSTANARMFEPPEEESAAQEARTLFSRGSSSYALSKYAESVTLFEESFLAAEKIEEVALRERVLQALRFNLARAHVKAYEIDHDVTRLRTALDLFDKYVDNGPELESELETEQLSTQVREELARLSGAKEEVKEEETESSEDVEAESFTGEEGQDEEGKAKSLRVGGYVALGLGVASLGLMGGGMAMASSAKTDYGNAGTQSAYDAALSQGKTGNVLAVSGAVAAGVLVSSGVALLVVGKRREGREGASASRIEMVPGVGVAGAGMWLRGRF